MMNIVSEFLPKLRNRHFLIIDILIFSVTTVLALILRLDISIALNSYKAGLVVTTILFLITKLAVFYGSGFYRRYWRYASIDELLQIAIAMAAAVVLQVLLFSSLYHLTNLPIDNLPRSLPLLDGLLSFVLVGGVRFSVRAAERVDQRNEISSAGDRTLIVGAGSGGISLVQQMQQDPRCDLYPVAFVDDDPQKLNLRIRGLPVVGNRHQIPEVVHSLKIRKVIIAMPSVSGQVIRDIVDICQLIGVQTSTLPGIHEILNDRISIESIREIKIEDLLRREPVQTDIQKVSEFLKGKTVLITGAGGSIGSELCRQILMCHPAEMILLGHGENSVFNIQQELGHVVQILKGKSGGTTRLTTFIADLRFSSRLEHAFEKYRPEIVFHAAAHKHVPLMELNPPEAITNNVLGTRNLLSLALQYQTKQFVMISTDKAVNPTNVMGASKRVAEMLVLKAAQTSGKPFVVVRFGNVLGSRGSVVPTFRKQIAAGGPVTVTHPEICRYFMTIPEAVQLVLQAAMISHGSEIFMLDMGQPVKIVDLAIDLIRLSGYEIGKDIEIVYTGLRPGEKLFEELLISGEQHQPTLHEKLYVVKNASKAVPEDLDFAVNTLCKAATNNKSDIIFFLLEQLVQGYIPKGQPKPNFKSNNLEANPKGKVKLKSKLSCRKVFKPNNFVFQQLEQDLQQALERQEFLLHYQPVIRLETGELTGFEALLRWRHPNQGLIYPRKFIPLAEETGLIIPIGLWVLGEVCRQIYAWQESTLTPLTVSINLSRKQFLQLDLVQQTTKFLKQNSLHPCNLRFEISENLVQENPDHAIAVISQLRASGVKLQVDNYGRSHSFYSLSECFPYQYEQFERLKIDRFLINRICNDHESFEIVQSITTAAHEAGIDMVATGVETKEQLAQLKLVNCEYGQGHFFSKPVEGKDLEKLIQVRK